MGLLEWLRRLLRGTPPPRPDADAGRPPPVEPPAPRPAEPAARPQPAPDANASADGTGRAGQQQRHAAVLSLDAGAFAPLPDDEVRRRAAGLGSVWSSPWFGRRDRIPPADDPRTELIDRALVAHGYLTPEELVEIHGVGQQMDELRPDAALAQHRAEAAVARSQEERAALRQRRKAETQERRRQHAEQVAERRRTDIVYLGRGVSRLLADRVSDAAKLHEAGLPVLATPADVAGALGIGVPRLRWLAFHSEAATLVHYVHFSVPKKSGGLRELAAPHRALAACQEGILRKLLDRLPAHAAACGFVRGKSTLDNAAPHAGRDVVVNTDLRDFFPTITFARVRGAFLQLGYSGAASTILALLCTEAPRRRVVYAGTAYHVATGPRRLPQGACTSPALSNLVARRLDARLSGLARTLGWTYTRYADDLSFSASGEAAARTGALLAGVRRIAVDEGFEVNETKTRVQRQSTAQSVTGLVVNRRPGVPRKLVRRLRAILHRARTEGLAAQNRDGRPNFEAWVAGMVAYVQSVNPEQGRPLREALDALRS